jgi:hypothetical protein
MALGFGLGSIDHFAPFQDSMNVVSVVVCVPTCWFPTALHEVAELHETPWRLAPGTDGLDRTGQGLSSQPRMVEPDFHPSFSTVEPEYGSDTMPSPSFSPTNVTVLLSTEETTATCPGSEPPDDPQTISATGGGKLPEPLGTHVSPSLGP